MKILMSVTCVLRKVVCSKAVQLIKVSTDVLTKTRNINFKN